MQDMEWTALAKRIQDLKPGAPAVWGKMALPQMLVHCRLQLEAALGDYAPRRKDNFFTRSLMRWMVLALPWPKGSATHPDYAVVEKKMAVGTESEERAALAETVARFARGGFQPKPHPMLGPLDSEAWARFQMRHLDHHLKQFGG